MKTVHEENDVRYEKEHPGLEWDSWKSLEYNVNHYDLRVIDKELHYVSMILTQKRGWFRKPLLKVYWRKFQSKEHYALERLKMDFETFKNQTIDIFSTITLRLNSINGAKQSEKNPLPRP